MKTVYIFGPEHAYFEIRRQKKVVFRSQTLEIKHGLQDMKTWLSLQARLERRRIAIALADQISFRRQVRAAYVQFICEEFGTDIFYPGPYPQHIATRPWKEARHGEWTMVPSGVAKMLINLKESA